MSLDAPLLAVFVLAAVGGALFGKRVAVRIAPGTLSASFAVMLILLALYTAARSVTDLA